MLVKPEIFEGLRKWIWSKMVC